MSSPFRWLALVWIMVPTIGIHSFQLTTEQTSRFTSRRNLSEVNDDSSSSTLRRFHDLLRPRTTETSRFQVDRMSSTDLAYIGDVVFEMFVRSKMVWPPKRTSDLQNQVVAVVRAEQQANMLRQLRQDLKLSTQEEQVLARGRNGAARNRRDPVAYQDATALEALLGWLYITDLERCMQLLEWADQYLDEQQ